MSDNQKRRTEFYQGTLAERKQTVLEALDRLLGVQSCTRAAKINALREVEINARRMAEAMERRLQQESEHHWLDDVVENDRPNSSHI